MTDRLLWTNDAMAKAMNRLAANALETIPKRSGSSEPMRASASSARLEAGKVRAPRSGQGRMSRPEIFTARAASQTLNRFVSVVNTAAAGGTAMTSRSTIEGSPIMRSYILRRVDWSDS